MARDETIKLSLIDGVTKGLAGIGDSLGKLRTGFTELNQAAELASKGFAAIGSAAAAVGGAVQGAADLESALARVADITRATAEEQVSLQQAVNNAVETVGVGADQAAQALVLMAEDGFSASEAIGALNTVLAYAKANAQDAATATNALGGVLDTFGEKPQIIGQLADQLTAASRAAGVGTATLQQGLAAVGVQAEQAGLGVSGAVAALSALASRGIEGTQAAKQLGTILTQLSDPASKAGKALEDAGLSGKSFDEIIAVLSGNAAKAAPVLEALGARPRAALRVLLAEGGGALREFTGIVDAAGGATQAAAAKIDETFNGAIARLQAAVGNLRNEFFAPILQPLAEEAGKLAEKINSLADSPGFARVREQFQALATNAIQSVGNLIENADLEQWAADLADFADDAKTVFDGLVLAVQVAADGIRNIGAAVDYVKEKAREFDEYFSDSEGSVRRFGIAAIDTEKSIGRLAGQLDTGKKKSREAAQAVDEAAGSADKFAGAADRAGDAADRAAVDMAKMPEPAKLIVGSLNDAASAADLSTLSLDALQRRLAAVREALAAAAPGSPEFAKLAQEAAALEAQLATTNEKIREAAGSTKDLGDRSDSTAGSLRNLASSARDAGDAAEEMGDRNSAVSDTFGNIGQQAAAAAVDMGNMSRALIDSALAMQAQARSGKEIIDIWEGVTRRYEQSNAAIQQQIDLIERRNAATDEEAKIRRQLEAQFGTDSTLLEKLVQLKVRENAERKKSLELAKEELSVERERIELASGALGFGGGTPQAGPTATGGRGASAGAGGRGPAAAVPGVTINVSGLPTDQAGWRDIVSRMILPEIERVQRLSR